MKEKSKDMVEIKPLKDFVIHMNKFHYEIKKGKPIEVNKMFLPNLRTEKVISKEGEK